MSYQWQQDQQADRPSVIADSLLITRILAGDQSAFEALVHKYERPLRGYIWRILKDEELMADVLQHVFLQLSFCLPTLNTNRPLKAWLFRVSYHRCLDELRKQQRQQLVPFSQLEGGDNEEEALFAETIPDGQPTPEGLLEQQELHEQLVHLLMQLPPTARAIVYLRSFKEWSFSEIGTHLNMPATTAKTYFHRVLPRLRAAFSAQELTRG